MCLKDVMHVCKLKKNTSIAFFQYHEKNLILTEHMELKCMDPNSQTTRKQQALCCLPSQKNGLSEN
jgi:hypothetical protein